jgi:hypothetical protein
MSFAPPQTQYISPVALIPIYDAEDGFEVWNCIEGTEDRIIWSWPRDLEMTAACIGWNEQLQLGGEL